MYTASAVSTGGRAGTVKGSEGFTCKLAMPKALGGPGNDAQSQNPEILFASGYAACFMGALGAVAPGVGQKIPKDATVKSSVGIGKPKDGTPGFALSVDLEVKLPGISTDDGLELLKKAHDACPYSRATRNNIEVTTIELLIY
ncbi:hypothetical protein HK101_011757 [Irineochytrium annulatum]|nr:hypothetical protein HK101_011757 [Irineochytrium annulatum]